MVERDNTNQQLTLLSQTCSNSGLSNITYSLQDPATLSNVAWPIYDPDTMILTVDTSNINIVSNEVYEFTLVADNGDHTTAKTIKIRVVE